MTLVRSLLGNAVADGLGNTIGLELVRKVVARLKTYTRIGAPPPSSADYSAKIAFLERLYRKPIPAGEVGNAVIADALTLDRPLAISRFGTFELAPLWSRQ